MEVIKTDIEGVVILEPKRFGDARGYFMETWRAEEPEAGTECYRWVQENESLSERAGVLRGLHFQRGDKAQAKLVRVSRGRVLDVAVDLRTGSKTYGRHVAVELTADNCRQLLIPRGFAHGFMVLEGPAQFQYKCDNYYAPEAEATLLWDDPALAITWPLDAIGGREALLLSPKDQEGKRLSELTT